MEVARSEKIRAIFSAAVVLVSPERERYLESACGGDATLRAEVEAQINAATHSISAGTPAQSGTPPQTSSIRLGPYRIVRELGRGGMGVVFLAVRDDGAFRKNVALKLLIPDQNTSVFAERFRQERQVLAGLEHPNIARILDGGDAPNGAPYYVMEFVEGVPLDRYSDDNRLSVGERVALFQQVCTAVHYLHENLVIHRDLKPSNILVAPGPTVKLLDFGIAKMTGPVQADVTSPQMRFLTPGYASPEQYTGEACTRASDVYSLGVILYVLLAGKLPGPHDLTAPSTNIREDIQRTPETVAELRSRIRGDLDHIVLKALQRNPANRYTSAAELASDLQRYLDGRPIIARKTPALERLGKWTRRNRGATASIAAGAMIVLAGGAWLALRPGSPATQPDAKPQMVQQPASQPASQPVSPAVEPALTPPAVPPVNLAGGAPPASGQPVPAKPATSGTQTRPTATPASPNRIQTAAPQSAPAANSTTAAATQQPAAPTPQTQAPPSPPPELRERLLRIAGRVRQADAIFEQLQKDLSARGLSPGAELISNRQQMRLYFDMAQGEINSGNFASVSDALDRADAFASRLLKAGGR